MSRLEELERAAGVARANWQWEEVRRIDAAIEAERTRLKQAAADLPPPDVGTQSEAGPGVPDFEEPLVRLPERPAKPPAKKPRRR